MNVPKLRFGEFADEWDIKLINDITSKVGSGSTPSGGASVYVDKGVLFIRSQNINNDQLIFDDATYISQSIHDKMKGSTVQANDVLLNITGASIGRSCVVPESFIEGNVNQHVSIIRFLDGYVPRFYQKYLSSERGQRHISSLQVGGGREGLNFQAIRKIAIPCPDTNEQQKIADFLSAVDEKITALTAQKTALTQYKQGMMQRIFTQTLRFKDDNGVDYPDWEEMRLGDLLDYEQPTKYLVSSTDYQNDYPTPVLTAGKTFILGYTDEQDGIFTNLPVIIFDDFTTANKFVNFPFKAKSSAMKMLKNDPTKSNLRFIYETMLLLDFATGDEHKRYWISEYQEQFIFMPCLKEQTKIAQFLTELDDKINAVDAQIQSAQQWKQGLLQQMFV